jgi:hypothetical protein
MKAKGAPWKLPPETTSAVSGKTIGVVDHRPQFDRRNPTGVLDGIDHSPMDLGRTAKRVSILHGVDEIVGMTGAELGAFEQPADATRRIDLSRMWSQPVNVGTEGTSRAEEGFH